MAAKKTTKKSAAPAKRSKVPKIKDLSPRKNPRGGEGGGDPGRPHQYADGGGSADE